MRPARTILAALALLAGLAPALGATPQCRPTAYDKSVYPPWQKGANNDAAKRGLEFTVPQADVMADFHGDLTDPKLVLYVGGNYFFAMAPLVKAFEAENPQFKGRLFWETIPPGLLAEQLKAGGTITSGNLTFTAKGDVYLAGLKKVRELVSDDTLVGPPVSYVTNTLAIMIPKSNPAHVTGLADLGRPGLRLVMPNPAFADSFNWGAGMERLSNASGFIKANMPLGQGGSLTDQEAWDVALFMDSHERPQDPRFTGDVATTRQQFHDTPNSMYGRTVDGKVLGAPPPVR